MYLYLQTYLRKPGEGGQEVGNSVEEGRTQRVRWSLYSGTMCNRTLRKF